MAMYIMFGDVSVMDKSDYLAKKIRHFFEHIPRLSGQAEAKKLDTAHLDTLTATMLSTLQNPISDAPIPLAQRSDFPPLKPTQQKAIDMRSACLMREIDMVSPLLEGETLVGEDFLTYLLEDFSHFSAGTPVLQRTTNMATLYYLITQFKVESNGNLAAVDSVPLLAPKHTATAPVKLFTAETKVDSAEDEALQMIVKVSKGLIRAIPAPYNFIGATLLDVIFPEKGINWTDVYNEIKKIVKEANINQTIHEQNGKINGVLHDLKIEYKAHKKNGASKDDLSGLLHLYHPRISEAIGTLGEEEFKKIGLASYLHAANIELAIYQEMALQDSKHSDPTSSSSAESVRLATDVHINHVTQVRKEIFNETQASRLQKIIGPHHRRSCSGASGYPVCSDWWEFEDTETHHLKQYDEDKDKSAESHCRRDHAEYVEQVKVSFQNKWSIETQWMVDIMDNWNKLKKDPIPK